MKTEKEQLTKLKTVGCWKYIKVTDSLKDKVSWEQRTTGDWEVEILGFYLFSNEIVCMYVKEFIMEALSVSFAY